MTVIRRMEIGDVDQVSSLEIKTFTQPWSRQAYLDSLEQPYARYYVAVEQERIAGCCGVRYLQEEGEITNVMVDEEFRRRGIASLLLAKLLAEGQAEGIRSFLLEVRVSNRSAIRLYEKFGFTPGGIRKNYYAIPREDALMMWKR